MIVGLAAVALLASCTRPTRNPTTLAAIRSEAIALMRVHPTKMDHELPKREWPKVMASLQPYLVRVDRKGVDILVKSDFDGGHGYYVLKNGQQLPGPQERYSKLADHVYWYRPY